VRGDAFLFNLIINLRYIAVRHVKEEDWSTSYVEIVNGHTQFLILNLKVAQGTSYRTRVYYYTTCAYVCLLPIVDFDIVRHVHKFPNRVNHFTFYTIEILIT
jgi:hypothetical protein